MTKHPVQKAVEKLAAEAAAAEAAAHAADPADTFEDTLIAPEIEAGKPKRHGKHGKR
jgi:hypothetical protein